MSRNPTTSADRRPGQGVFLGALAAVFSAVAQFTSAFRVPPSPETPVRPAVRVLSKKELPTMTDPAAAAPNTSVIAKVEADIAGAEQKVVQTAEKIWSDIETGVTILKDEGQAVVHWIDTNIPDAAPVVQQFLVAAEQSATNLLKAGAGGANGAIGNMAASIEEVVANFLQSSGLANAADNSAGTLSKATITTGQTLLQDAVNVGLAKVLGAFAPAVAG